MVGTDEEAGDPSMRGRWLASLVVGAVLASAQGVERAPIEPPPPAKARQVEDFALIDTRGVFHRLSAERDAALVVLFVHQVGCPIVRGSVAELQRLSGIFTPQGVRFLLLDASSEDTRAAIVEEAEGLGLTLPVLRDESQVVAEGLGITRTAEAIVVRTKDWSIAWRGPLDDRLGYGAQKEQASHHWLGDALIAVLADQAPASASGPLKGCVITYAKPKAADHPDFAKDVAPILSARCRDCHQKGGIGPWAMTSEKKVAGWASMIREVVRTRAMPPWGADRGYGAFANDCSLTVEETRTLVHWVEGGAVESPSDPLVDKPAKVLPEWPLGRPDLIVPLPEQAVPATGVLPYRMADVTLELPRDTIIRAVDLRPSNRKLMHHAFAFVDGQEELPDDIAADPRVQALLERLKGQPLPPEIRARLDKRPRGLTSFFASYVPGMEPAFFPKGTGKLLPKNAKLTFQLHYTTNGEAGVDRPRLGLYFAKDKVDHELKVTSAFQLKLDIPPQTKAYPVEAMRTFLKDEVIYALSPHMHFRGSAMRFIADYPDGRSEILLSVPQYDLNWQRSYQLATPKAVPAGTKLRCVGMFDNSATNESNPDPTKRVHFGEQSWDEMFIGYIVYADANPADVKTRK
jgi:peroxiredoxin